MSDASSKNGPSTWGTIFAGGREHTLSGLEHTKSTAWTSDDEAAYLERVRTKAKVMAERLLAEAGAQGEQLRRKAEQEGYQTGMERAQEEMDEFRAGIADSVSAVLTAIEGQCAHIFAQWREEINAVARLAVERIAGITLSQERAQVLAALLEYSVTVLERRRELVIRVHPEDESMVNTIINITKERFPDVGSWRVRADASITPGGMLVESESSLADSRLESRIYAVDEILRQLTLPDRMGVAEQQQAQQTQAQAQQQAQAPAQQQAQEEPQAQEHTQAQEEQEAQAPVQQQTQEEQQAHHDTLTAQTSEADAVHSAEALESDEMSSAHAEATTLPALLEDVTPEDDAYEPATDNDDES